MIKANNFEKYTDLIGTLSNLEVRKWYIHHDKNIVNKIDKSLSIKEQAKQAHSLRNKYRMQARKLMKDRELAEYLDVNNSNLPFDYYEKKYLKQGYNGVFLYEKILDSSTKSNRIVNERLGLAQ